MNILHRRPLFLCCSLFMLASLAGLFWDAAAKWILGGIFLVGMLLYARLSFIRRRDTYRAVLAVAVGILFCLALLRSHTSLHSPTHEYLRSREQSSVQVCATVTDRRGSGGNMTAYTLMLESVDGYSADGLAVLTCYYVSSLQPGNRISIEATVIPLSETVGNGYDAVALMGDGYIAGLLSEDETKVIVVAETDENPGNPGNPENFAVRAGKLRRTLAARLNLLTGREADGLPSALLLGDKTTLSDSVHRDFARVGVSHLLAISGLHVTLLFGLLGVILRFLRVAKRVRTVILGAGAVGYLCLLGFPPSATRAVIMLGVTYVGHLLSEQADSLTSLGVAGAWIVAATPYAVMDAGFWMSFLAVLGIVTVMPLVQEYLDRLPTRNAPFLWQLIRRDLLKFVAALLVGLVAVSFTLFVVAAVIGQMGILSPVVTVLLTPFCAMIILLSALCIPLMGTEIGGALGDTVRGICGMMTDITAWMAKPSWVVVSLRHPSVLPIAAVLLIATIVLLIIRLPSRRRGLVLLPMLTGWVMLSGILGLHGYFTRDRVSLTYLQPSSASEALVLVAGRQGLICDLTNGSLSSMSSAAQESEALGATELAVYMLTHYHTSTAGSLETLMDREMIRALWLPHPKNPQEYECMLACLEKANRACVLAYVYENGEALTVFGTGILTAQTSALRRSTQPVLLISLDLTPDGPERDGMVYCGSAVFESDLAQAAEDGIAASEMVIFGSHGPLFKQAYGENMEFSHVQTVIFSEYGDAAAWFDSADLPAELPLWVGQKRVVLSK